MEKIVLFETKKERFIFLLLFFILFCLNLSFKFAEYNNLTKSPYVKMSAEVLAIYPKITKRGKKYNLLKLKTTNGIKFFGISWKRVDKDLLSKKVSLKLKTKNITFFTYLKGFFAPVYGLKVIDAPKREKEKLLELIKNQHKSPLLKELFGALFLGGSVSKDLRKRVQNVGISHLIAISGFHLSVLLGLFYLMLTPVYRFFQDKFFPYRSLKLDLMIASIFLLLGYLYLVGFLPSLVRAFTMVLIGYFLYIRHIKILSFETLFVTIVILLALFPALLFSMSFWFSVAGVFYIFLFLHHFSFLKKWQIFIFINFWVFFMMLPVVHLIFYQFTPYQLLSPFITIGFILFYPIELFLHLINEGYMLDPYVLKLLSLEVKTTFAKTPFWFSVLFLFVSLVSIYKKLFLYFLILLDGIFFIYLIH